MGHSVSVRRLAGFFGLLGLAFFGSGNFAFAHHCYISTPSINFGKVDPLRIEGTETPATINLNCWAVTSPTHYCITVKDDVAERFIKSYYFAPGKYQIPFNFYYNNTVLGIGVHGKPIIGTLQPITGRPEQYPTIPISVKLGRPEGMDLGADLYTGTFQTSMYGAYGQDNLTDSEKEGMCQGIRPTRVGIVDWTESSQTFTVSANIEKACSVLVSSIKFDKATDLSKVEDKVGAVRVKCTPPVPYEIGLSFGNNLQGKNQRAMKCNDFSKCKTERILYNLYTDPNYSNIWTNTQKSSGTLTFPASDNTQTATVYARVDKTQPPVSPGPYIDNITVTIWF